MVHNQKIIDEMNFKIEDILQKTTERLFENNQGKTYSEVIKDLHRSKYRLCNIEKSIVNELQKRVENKILLVTIVFDTND